METAFGLKWEMGVAKLPGSDIQIRLDENGDVEVMSGEGTETESLDEFSVGNMNNNNNDGIVLNLENNHVPENIVKDSIETNSQQVQNSSTESVDSGKVNTVSHLSRPYVGSAKARALVNVNAIVKCEYCGKVGRRRKFMGRFCTKVCIARNAVEARKSKSSFVKQKLNKIKRGKMKSLKQKSRSVSINSGLKRKVAFPQTKPRQPKADGILAKHPLKKRSFQEIMSETLSNFETFTWDGYLADQNAVGLDCKQFELITGRSAYPTKQNPFREGQSLEVVDPLHQSLICIASVVQVEGLRMRLHFLDYYDCYDFWIDADSPFVFPRGLCDKTKRQLCGPDNHLKANADHVLDDAFSPSLYTNTTKFKVGDKLEAVDRKHHNLICVATVTDIIGEHVLIHFDGWEKDFDYWALSSSPFIHPIGWCEANKKELSPPPNHNRSAPFVWSDYLKISNSFAADTSCFKLNGNFEVGMKIEAVDQRNSILVRVATIIEVNDLQIKVHYDGWSSMYDDWFDVDSRDIHPINWCQHAGYPLHPPVDDSKLYKKSCPVKGCPSLGHLNSPKYFAYHRKHYSEHGCPYSSKNMTKKEVVNDRFAVPSLKASGIGQKKVSGSGAVQKGLGNRQGFRLKQGRKRSATLQSSPFKEKNGEEAALHPSYQQPKRFNASRLKKSARADFLTGESGENGATSKVKHRSMHDLAIRSSVISSLASLSSMHLPHCWDKNVRHLPGVDGTKSSEVMKWDIGRVAAFVTTLTGKPECGNAFEREEVDGEALLLLSQNDILNTLKLKLGPAVKIYNAVLFFKVFEKDFTS